MPKKAPDESATEAPPPKKWKAVAKGMPELAVEAVDATKAREAYIAKLKLNTAAPVTVTAAE